MDTGKTRTWAEIDLSALEHNYRLLRELAGPGCGFVGLCKADAYGHGAVPVARKLEQLGADLLAVACVEEAVQLREHGIALPILCLGITPVEQAPLLLKYRVTQTVESLEMGRQLSQIACQAGQRLPIHVKLDTGMSRLGFFWDGEEKTAEEMAQLCRLPGLEAQGMFTHFANADGDPDYTRVQLQRFRQAREALQRRGIRLSAYHCASSAGAFSCPEGRLDLIRPGIALYGYHPCGAEEPELRPVMQVYSRIAAVRALPRGTAVSYGCTAVLERDSRLAVVPMGYGDGLPRSLSNRFSIYVDGKPCPVVGRICMDMCMIDVTDLPQVKAGDIAGVYVGKSLERAAEITDTIPYELLCRMAPRVPRIYVEGSRIVGTSCLSGT